MKTRPNPIHDYYINRIKLDDVLRAGLLVLVFSLPWRNAVVLFDGVTIGRVTGIFVFTLWAMTKIHTKKANLSVPIISMLLFSTWVIISISWSPEPSVAVGRASTVVLSIVVAVILYDTYVKREDVVMVLLSLLLGGIVLCILILYIYVVGSIEPHQRRVIGFNLNATAASRTLVYIFVVSVYLIVSDKYYSIGITFILLATPSIIFTGSRQAIVGLGITAMTYSIFILYNREDIQLGRVFRIVIGALISAGLVMTALSPVTLERILSTPYNILEGDFGGRRQVWESGFASVTAPHLFGTGIGAYFSGIAETLPANTPHNTFLGVFVELGLIGIGLFILILLSVLKTSVSSKEWPFCFSVMGTYIALAIVADVYLDAISWVLLTTLLLVNRREK